MGNDAWCQTLISLEAFIFSSFQQYTLDKGFFFFFLREKWERGGERNKLLEEQSRKLLLTRDGRLR